EYREPSGNLVLAEVHLDPGWVARPIRDIESRTRARVAYVTRLSEGIVAHEDLLLQDGDLVHLMCTVDRLGEIERILDQPVREEEEGESSSPEPAPSAARWPGSSSTRIIRSSSSTRARRRWATSASPAPNGCSPMPASWPASPRRVSRRPMSSW